MRKIYIQPRLKQFVIETCHITAGSPEKTTFNTTDQQQPTMDKDDEFDVKADESSSSNWGAAWSVILLFFLASWAIPSWAQNSGTTLQSAITAAGTTPTTIPVEQQFVIERLTIPHGADITLRHAEGKTLYIINPANASTITIGQGAHLTLENAEVINYTLETEGEPKDYRLLVEKIRQMEAGSLTAEEVENYLKAMLAGTPSGAEPDTPEPDTPGGDDPGEPGECDITAAAFDEEKNAFNIATPGQLMWFAQTINSLDADKSANSAYLSRDIDLTHMLTGSTSWMPIGWGTDASGAQKCFSATFDGCGHTIRGLVYTTDESLQGLFGYLNGAIIKNLYVEGSITAANKVGGLAGNAYYSTITNVGVNVNVTSTTTSTTDVAWAGGIVATTTGSTFTGVWSLGNVTIATKKLDCTGLLFGLVNQMKNQITYTYGSKGSTITADDPVKDTNTAGSSSKSKGNKSTILEANKFNRTVVAELNKLAEDYKWNKWEERNGHPEFIQSTE